MNAAPHSPNETALQKERRIFRETFDHLINTALNWIFDLRPERAQRRTRSLSILFILSGAVITLIYYPPGLWAAHIQDLLLYILNPSYAANYVGDPFLKFFNFVFGAIFDPRALQYLPIFIAPFFIAQQLAAYYLADIFELEDITVARQFVVEVGLTGSDETIRISKGKIVDEHQQSSNFLIGGPGKVIVDLDSAALFERADGTPHVIGPTGKEPQGKATIAGFERLRETFDLRDHQVELRDQNPKAPSVKSRSLDGIPITATDVSLMFSIDRGANPETSAEFPYPFNKEAIEKIVYNASSRVAPEKLYPSEYKFEWINIMIGLIRGQLGGFMNSRKLTEYLASAGAPEFEKIKQREELIAQQIKELAQPNGETVAKSPKSPPEFMPRYKISNLFSQFAEGFTKSARNSGVTLRWIGLGTWKTPPEIDIVSENHLEAWRLSQENMKQGSPEALNRAQAEATLQKMKALIDQIPFATFKEITDWKKGHRRHSSFNKKQRKDPKSAKEISEIDLNEFSEDERVELLEAYQQGGSKAFNRLLREIEDSYEEDHIETEAEHRDNLRSFLLEYRKLFTDAVQVINAKNEPVPASIEESINYINQQMGFRHWAGKS